MKGAKNLEWANDKTILADVMLDDGKWYPYCASQDDISKEGVAIYERLASGEFGVPVNNIQAKAAERLALENNVKKSLLISNADSHISPLMGYAIAGIMSDVEKETFKAWNEYRKALEDVDVAATNIEWPAKPE